MLDLLALEDDVIQRCLSAQPAPHSVAEVQQGQVCAHLLRDLASTAPSALFSQQLLDLTCRWWSEAEGPDIDVNDVYSLAAAAKICIKLHAGQTVHEVVAEEYHVLESVNYELVTYTLADWFVSLRFAAP